MMVIVVQLLERKLADKPKYSEKTYPSATLSTTNSTRAAAVGSQRLTA
jgi:hypothetical protein